MVAPGQDLQLMDFDDDQLSMTVSFEISQDGFNIVRQGVRISKDGIRDAATGENFAQVQPQEIEYCEELGRGNGGVVHRAVLRPSNVELAVKMVGIYEKEKRHQLYADLKALVKNDSPHMIRFYGAFYDEGKVYLALEYMDCGSIKDFIDVMKQVRPVSPDPTFLPEVVISKIVSKVLHGLVYVHETLKQVHRDIKTENILVNSKRGDAKLADFGVSKELEATLQMCSTFIGTIAYMSPERINNDAYSFSSDIWAIGLVVLEMAMSELPYRDCPTIFVLHQKIKTEPSPSLQGKGCSPALVEFVDLCLQKEPASRPSARQLLTHPFISNHADNDKDYQQFLADFATAKKNVIEMNSKKELTADQLGLGDLVGMNN